MRKIIILLSILLVFGGTVFATNPDQGRNRANARVYSYIDGVYAQLNYMRGMNKMKLETFRSAYYGYLNLLEHGKISNKRYLTICDYSLSSNTNRLWLIDLKNNKVIINTLVAHGSATGDEFANRFSNIPESHQSSLGFYVTKQTYSGAHGYSLRLSGVDGHFNSNAESRDVVMHGADYVSQEFARANKRIGRSWGCPSVEMRMASPIIDKIRNGSCLFIYHPTQSYLRSSFWLNNPVVRLPKSADDFINENEINSVDDEIVGNDVERINKSHFNELTAQPKDTFLMTVTEYKDPVEIEILKNDKSIRIETLIIPEDQITPEIRAKILKKQKVVRKISNIIYVGGSKDEPTVSE